MVAPAVAWLCHPDCPENGSILQAMAGRFSRTVIGDAGAFWALDPEAEHIGANFSDPAAFPGLHTARSSSEIAHRIANEALGRLSISS